MTTPVRLPYDIYDRNDTLYSYILTFFMPPLTVGTTPPLIVKAFDSSVLDPTLWPVLEYGTEWTVRQSSNTFEVIILNPTNYEPWDKLQIEASEAYERTVDVPVNYNKNALDTDGDYQTRLIQQINGRLTYLERHIWSLIGTIRPPNEKGRMIMIDDDTGHAIFRGCNMLQESDGTVSAFTNFNVFSDVFAINGVIDEDLHVSRNLTVGQNITASNNISASQNITAGAALTVAQNATIGGALSVTGNGVITADLSVSQDITGNNLTVATSSNLNYIYANSAVITVIEANNINSGKATVSNLETVNHISNDVTTEKLTAAVTFTIPNTCEFVSNGERFGWYMDFTDPAKTNLVIETVNGRTVIKNDVMPAGGGGIGNINITASYIPKGDDAQGLVDSSITDDGTKVTIGKDCFTTNLTTSTYLALPFGSSMVTSGAVFQYDFVGDFETKPYLQFYRTIEGQLKVTNTALPSVDVSAKYDSSGVLSGFVGTFVGDTVTIAAGTGIVWNGTAYQEVITSAPIAIQVSTAADSYIFLRWDGAGGLEAYVQATPPSNTQRVQDIYLLFVTAHDGTVYNLFNRFRNLNQQLEQVIDILGLSVPYSNMAITLTEGTANFVRTAGNFKAFGIKNVPSNTAKYDTSTIFSITDNAPTFTVLDIYKGNGSIDITDFPFPPKYLDNSALVDIPADSWGYYEVLVNAYGQVRFIYPIDVFVSLEPNSGDAQQSLKDLTAIKDFKVDGFAVIGMLGLKGGAATFEADNSVFYQNAAQIGGAATVVEINLPDPNAFNEGDRMTVVDVGGGAKEWYGMPDNVKTANVGQEAYYDTTGTISGRDSRIRTGTPGYYAVYDPTGLTLEPNIGPSFTSNVKPGTVGKPAYYDTATTVSSSVDHLVPNPTTGDLDRVLGATGDGTIGWVDQATGGGSGAVTPGTIGQPAVYTAAEEVGSSTNLLVNRPAAINTGQIYTALGEGSAGWRDFTGSIDNVVITKIVSDSQQAGDILTTLSKRRLYSTGNRIYDNYSRRELLALDGQVISLKQYMGFGLKADLAEDSSSPGGEPLNPIQGTSVASATYRHIRFFRTLTNEKYVLEIEGGAWDTTVTGVHLGTINPKTGVITRIRTHTSWPEVGAVSRPQDFGIFFVVDVVNNYYAFNVYTGASPYYRTYFYNLTTGAAGAPITTNRWSLPSNFDYSIFNGHLYVFYRGGSFVACDKILINATDTGVPTLNYVRNGVNVGSRSLSLGHKIRQIDENTLVVFFSYLDTAANSYVFYHITYDLSNDTQTAMYTSTQKYVNFSPTSGSCYHDGLFYVSGGGLNHASGSGGRVRVQIKVGTSESSNAVALPGTTLGLSHYDQHPKYTNVVAFLKNNKSQLFIAYDYGTRWNEVVGFDAATQFWPTNSTGTTSGITVQYDVSRTIWLDDNNTNMIFTGWLQNGGTNAPCAFQPLGVTAGEATLPTWQDGAYIVSTEFQYTPVTWFDAGGGLVIGETFHTRRMPLAKAITSAGEITTIDWAVGTTPPSAVVGFASTDKIIGTWAVSDKSVYHAADGYSFSQIYTAGQDVFINQVAYYDENRCLIATYQTDPVNSTTIALVNTDGNIQVIYNVSSAYPVVADLVATDYYVIFSRLGVNQVVWADRSDLIFGAVAVGAQIKKLASAGLTTHGLSSDGLVIYQWTGKGETELTLRTFGGGDVINDIASEPGKLFAVGYTGADGSAYMYNYTSWVDYVGIGTNNQFNVVEISTTSISDIIIAGQNGFFSSNDGFDNQPRQLTIATGSTQPLDVKSLSIDTTKAFTVFFGVDGSDQGFNYRAGDTSTSIITDLLENRYNGVMVGTVPMGYVITKKPIDDFWTRQLVQLIPGSTFTQRQTIAEGLNGAIYIQNDEGHIGVSTDGGETYNVAAASPIGESGRGGAFVGGLLGNVSLMALGGGRMLKSNDDWATSTEWTPFNPDQVCTSFSRDLGRTDIVYMGVSQQGTGTNVCRVERFNASDNWTAPARLLDITLAGGRYFTRIASYNDRIIVVQSDGALRYSVDGGLTWSGENTSIIDTPAVAEGITSIWIENTTDCVYIAKTGGVFYNTFVGLDIGEPWIQEDVPVSADQQIGAHLINSKRTMGMVGNVGVGIYWRRYDT